MALNQFYPYQYPYQQNYQQGYQQNNQIQNSGLVSVRSMEEAYNYPVAPGNSITFKDETQPFVYTKTKGFSPLEQPVFEKYRLVKVDDAPQKQAERPSEAFDAHSEIKRLWEEINALKTEINGLEVDHDKSNDDTAV